MADAMYVHYRCAEAEERRGVADDNIHIFRTKYFEDVSCGFARLNGQRSAFPSCVMRDTYQAGT